MRMRLGLSSKTIVADCCGLSREALLTRRELVCAISPTRTGNNKSKWNPHELSRPQATKVVNIFFDSIASALCKGEKVVLPIGTFEVLEHTRPPLRRRFLKRIRVTYA